MNTIRMPEELRPLLEVAEASTLETLVFTESIIKSMSALLTLTFISATLLFSLISATVLSGSTTALKITGPERLIGKVY